MNKTLIIIGVAVLLVCVGLSGCNEKSGNSKLDRLIGTWMENGEVDYIFESDRTFTSFDGPITTAGTYEIKDEKLVLTVGGISISYNYSFSNNDRTLTMTMVDTNIIHVYTKQ